ncbi:MAG: hypothetical protein NZ750_11815 [Anaerolineae bacterium]|nr:hypothetical protein [Anaerolineae bacterium]MDW8173952.1 hypothetical protein [Anaerolineae bacterium]
MSGEARTAKCIYIHHDNGIHEFILADGSDEALDGWFIHLDQVFGEAVPVVRLLYVSQTDALPSINALMTRARLLDRRHPGRPKSRSAILYNSASKVRFLNVFVQMSSAVGRDQSRFFSKDQRQEAIEWLLRDS